MKKSILYFLFLMNMSFGYAQQTYTVKGESLELKTEVEGNLDLLWTIKDCKYRFFVKTKDGTLTELKNNKQSDNFPTDIMVGYKFKL